MAQSPSQAWPEQLHRAARGGKDAFDRTVFGWLLDLQRMPDIDISQDTLRELLPLLAQWLRAAPLATPREQLRLITVRHALHGLVLASATALDDFLAGALDLPGDILAALPWQRRKFALLGSSRLRKLPDLDAWSTRAPDEAWLFAIAALTQPPIGAATLGNMNAVVDMLADAALPALPFEFLVEVNNASYGITFATHPRKYDARANLNRLLASWSPAAPAATQLAPAAQARKRLVVVSENFTNMGVMDRCYSPVLAGLRDHFHVTWLAEARTRGNTPPGLADDLQFFETAADGFPALATRIAALRPDVVFYPSVGMAPWTLFLACCRLAPLQVASIGHPGPVGTPAIDYLAVPEELAHPDAHLPEPLLTYSGHPIVGAPYRNEAFDAIRALRRQPRSGPPRIGIDASAMKLNHDFLEAIHAVLAAAPAGTRLRFFPNTRGLQHITARAELLALFPDAEVLPGTAFKPYMEALVECDLVLQSFPVGGTNTTIDALALGIPTVCLASTEIQGRTDGMILQRIGLAHALLGCDRADWQDKAVRLLHDDAARAALGERCAAALAATLAAPDDAASDFAARLRALADRD